MRIGNLQRFACLDYFASAKACKTNNFFISISHFCYQKIQGTVLKGTLCAILGTLCAFLNFQGSNHSILLQAFARYLK